MAIPVDQPLLLKLTYVRPPTSVWTPFTFSHRRRPEIARLSKGYGSHRQCFHSSIELRLRAYVWEWRGGRLPPPVVRLFGSALHGCTLLLPPASVIFSHPIHSWLYPKGKSIQAQMGRLGKETASIDFLCM